MATQLTKKEVEKIAHLARLDLTQEELDIYTEQLSAILGYIDQLQEVDTENVPITTQVTGLSNVLREDSVDACDNASEIIACAPEHEDNQIKVKAVFSSES